MNELLEKLNELWNSSEDERFKGENPACDEVLEAIGAEFVSMEDDTIIEILDGLTQEQLEQLQSVFEDLVDERDVFENYIQ